MELASRFAPALKMPCGHRFLEYQFGARQFSRRPKTSGTEIDLMAMCYS
jgi:hypothetical protein